MKLGLVGEGKLGQAIRALALRKGHTISGVLNSQRRDFALLREAEVCIECTKGELVLSHVRELCLLKKNIIVGTTGWEKDREKVASLVEKSHVALLYAPNFSLGVYLFSKLVEEAARLFAAYEQYQIGGVEIHHKEKQDAPSGTALALSKVISAACPRLHPFSFFSVRLGSHVGTHQMEFDSPMDMIKIEHQMKNREGFAEGAIRAAEWIVGKKGFYTFEDMVQ